jgi:hypothetical protein
MMSSFLGAQIPVEVLTPSESRPRGYQSQRAMASCSDGNKNWKTGTMPANGSS